MEVWKVRCIPDNENGGDFSFQNSENIKKKREGGLWNREGVDNGFLRGNLHAQWENSAGNWTLIGSEVERDQLA